MVTTLMSSTPGTGLPSDASAWAAAVHSARTAPVRAEQGTGLSFAGSPALALPVQVAFGARLTDLPGSRPRGAPV